MVCFGRVLLGSTMMLSAHSSATAKSVGSVHAPRNHSNGRYIFHFVQRRTTASVRASAYTEAAPAPQVTERAKAEDTADFLKQELKRLFATGEITASKYAQNIVFEDPITRFNDINGYLLMIRALRTLFNITFDLHDVQVTAPDEITTRWTMSMEVWELPWKPTLLFSGRSFYKIDSSGLISSHRDVWDAVDNNSYMSPEALALVIKQLLEVQLTPDLETPSYQVLRVTRDYEVRRYDPFIVAETAMPPGSTPASGVGFTDLAGYIFGGNKQRVKMEMTTPVFTRSPAAAAAAAAAASGAGTAGGASSSNSSSSSTTMQFVLEKKFGDVNALPQPNSSRVNNKQLQGSYVAAIRFSGWPLDFEVKEAERQLRAALARDGLTAAAGYSLARYNEPTVLPFLRRNEVLIDLVDFQWP